MDLATRGKILELRQSHTIRAIAAKVGVSRMQVFRVAGPQGLRENHVERNASIRSLRREGRSYSQVAELVGLSKRSIYRICQATCLLLSLSLVGCDEISTKRVRALPEQPAEAPQVSIPAPIRQTNWRGPLGQGSCVYASLTTHTRWQNNFELADWCRKQGDGEYGDRLKKKLDAIGVKHASTEQASVEFLDWCAATRRGCILWWKPSHCCTFAGYVVRNGVTYCAIIDNNQPGTIELTERGQFLRLWAGYGGFGLAILGAPASPLPWLSYEFY
jgi:hypothetical protein